MAWRPSTHVERDISSDGSSLRMDEFLGLVLGQLPGCLLEEKCRKLVVYCEKLWLHREDLIEWQDASKRTVRPMLVPFNLK